MYSRVLLLHLRPPGEKTSFLVYFSFLPKGACELIHILIVCSYLLTHFTAHIKKLEESRIEGKGEDKISDPPNIKVQNKTIWRIYHKHLLWHNQFKERFNYSCICIFINNPRDMKQMNQSQENWKQPKAIAKNKRFMPLSDFGIHTKPLYRHLHLQVSLTLRHAETRSVWERLLSSITVKINSFVIVEGIKVWHSNLAANIICYQKSVGKIHS